MMMGFGPLGLILMLVFWGLLIAGALWFVRYIFPGISSPGSSTGKQPMGAREILDHRYARGELTREHYLAMIDDLKNMGDD
jgi:putative membrane protein